MAQRKNISRHGSVGSIGFVDGKKKLEYHQTYPLIMKQAPMDWKIETHKSCHSSLDTNMV